MKKLITLITSCCLVFTYASAQYCTPYSLNCDETISNVTLNTINNSSTGCGTVQGYSDYSSVSTSLTAGTAYPLGVSVMPSYQTDVVDVWIDYNHNQIFDPSELVTTITGYTNSATTAILETYSLTVPVTALAGNTRMRLRLRYSAQDVTAAACDTLNWGEAEDYTVNIVLPPCTGLPAAPTITNASPVYACPSSGVTLTATDPNHASGIAYQWQSSATIGGVYGNVIGGSGSATLSYTTPTIASSVFYKLTAVCSNNIGAGSSSSNIVAVSPGTAASITTQPANKTICAGSSTSFSVTGAGTPVLAYQWQVNAGSGFTNLADNATYTGSTASTLNITNATSLMNGYIYKCIIVSNGCSPGATSATATLTVNSAPTITTQPVNQNVCSGNNTTFSITATGAGLTYQWQLSVGTTFANINNNSTYSGATTNTLNVAGVTTGMNGYAYRCVVSGTCTPSAISGSGAISIGLVAPSITASGSTSVCDGAYVYLSSSAGNAYQWYLNNIPIPGATSSTYAAGIGGNYAVVITAVGGCSGSSSSITITVNPAPAQPNISATGSTDFCLGSGVLLISDVNSGLPTQWLLNNGAISGANGTSYNATDSGNYSLQVTGTNSCISVSAPVQTTVYDLPVPVLASPADYTMCVTATGPYTSYQWYNNGQAISGATASCYTAVANGSYSVSAADGMGCSKMSFPMVYGNVGVSNLAAIKEAIRIYPNPATSVIHVDAPVAVNIAVSGIDGRIVYYEKNVKAMDISTLATGVYVVTVYDENNVVMKIEKLVKE